PLRGLVSRRLDLAAERQRGRAVGAERKVLPVELRSAVRTVGSRGGFRGHERRERAREDYPRGAGRASVRARPPRRRRRAGAWTMLPALQPPLASEKRRETQDAWPPRRKSSSSAQAPPGTC